MSETAARPGNPIVEYFRGFAVLKETRREYWGIQLINFLDCTAYFALLGIVIVFLSEDLGFSDVHAGYVVTAFTMGVTTCLFATGFLTDWLGIRTAIYVAMVGALLTRFVVVLAGLVPDLPYRAWVGAVGVIVSAPFMAMTITTFQAANRRFTTGKSRGAGFNLWYLFMNVGAAAGGFLVDIVRKILGLPNAYIIAFGMFSAVACVLVAALLVRREEQLYGPDERPAEAPPKKQGRKPWDVALEVVVEPVFWRFIVLCTLLLGVRAVFLYLHLLWPKYWLRVIGPDAAIGTLQAVNPVLVVIGLIVLIPILGRYSVYGMLTYGAIISALSLFVMAIPSHGNEAYWVTLAALLVLTVGEVIWSPRLTEYTAAIAPKGQEGTYLGLSMVPWFFAKLVVSMLSGHMLARWVPEYPKGEPILRDRLAAGEIPFWQSPSALWIILGIFALAGPVIALLLRSWFTKGAYWAPGEAKEPAGAPAREEAAEQSGAP